MSNPTTEEEFVSELTAHQAPLQTFVISLMPGDSGVEEVVLRTNITLWRKRETFSLAAISAPGLLRGPNGLSALI